MTSPETPSLTRVSRLRESWLSNPKADLLSGLVVALALIPEAISFSIIAGVDPKVGLYASFSIAIIISIAGGRSGMISAATGAGVDKLLEALWRRLAMVKARGG